MSKISELSDGGSIQASDYLIAVRSGGNVKVRMDSINVDQVDLGDNEFIRLGNSQDLTLVHNASNSIINQAGIGDLLIQKAGATKLTVNSTGVDITGTVTADGLTVDGDVAIASNLPSITLTDNDNSSSRADIEYNFGYLSIDADANAVDAAEAIDLKIGGTTHFRLATGGDINFYENTGTSVKFFWDASQENLAIGASSVVSDAKLQLAGAQGSTQSIMFTGFGTDKDAAISHNNGNIIFSNGGNNTTVANLTERMRLDADGHAIIPAGVTLGTAVGTYNAANTLDDYEEGTWTITVKDGTGNTYSGTYQNRSGRYTKVGRIVTVTFELYVGVVDLTSNGLTGNQALVIAGLPFNSNSDQFTAGAVSNSNGINYTGDSLGLRIGRDTDEIQMISFSAGTGGNDSPVTVTQFNNGNRLVYGTAVYTTA